MYKFTYLTTSDGDRVGAVSSDFIADRLINRGIQVVATTESANRISFGLSDGGHVDFTLKASGAEIVYHPASKG
jgi:hypothetical protein